jgi:hypothetical protein
MVIGFLCPILIEGVIRGVRWSIGPKGDKAFSSHHIWTFIPPARPSVGQNLGGGYGRTDGRTDGRTYGHNYGHMDIQTYGHMDIQTYGHTDIRRYGQTDGMNVHM